MTSLDDAISSARTDLVDQDFGGGRRIVSWEEPPPAAHGNRVYDDIAEQLQKNIGVWARLDDRTSEAAAQQFACGVRTGRFPAFQPSGAFDARHKDVAVWVRFVGLDLRR